MTSEQLQPRHTQRRSSLASNTPDQTNSQEPTRLNQTTSLAQAPFGLSAPPPAALCTTSKEVPTPATKYATPKSPNDLLTSLELAMPD
jgi:hypothetical protein